MADRAKKISELTAHTNAPANNLLVIVHQPGLANNETRKISLTNFFANVAANVSFTGKVSTPGISGPYASDAAANTAGVPVKGLYYDSTGAIKIRLT